jgi:hypothetical protein
MLENCNWLILFSPHSQLISSAQYRCQWRYLYTLIRQEEIACGDSQKAMTDVSHLLLEEMYKA